MAKKRDGKILIPKKSKIAFVCSGGAAKAGAFHLGVALALREKGFKFIGGMNENQHDTPNHEAKFAGSSGNEISIYVGSSAGSLICAYLGAGYSLDQIFDSFLRKKPTLSDSQAKALKPLTYYELFSFKRDTGFVSALSRMGPSLKLDNIFKLVQDLSKESYENMFKMKWLKLPGFFSTAGIETYLRESVLPSNDFRKYKADMFMVGTQLNHSRKVVFGKYDQASSPEDKSCIYTSETSISEAVAASTSLPPMFSPYPIAQSNGKKTYYFDGEIRDTLSTHVASDHGADLIFASYTHQPYHYLKAIGSLHHFGLPSILIQALYLMIERKIQAHRQFQDRSRALHDALEEFFKENRLSPELQQSCLHLVQEKLNFKPQVDTVYIHPRAADHEMFFGNHFNLSASKLKDLVRIGFKSAIHTLRRYEFE